MSASVTMSLSEYEALKSASDSAIKKAGDLIAELEEAKKQLPSDDIYLRALQKALVIIQFTVANHDPQATKDWPYRALRELAGLMKDLPVGIPEMAFAFEQFSHEAERWERLKSHRVIKTVSEGANTQIVTTDLDSSSPESP